MTSADILLLRNGGRREFWLSHLEQVASFIKEKQLKPIDANRLPVGTQVVSREAAMRTVDAQSVLLWEPRFGGWPLPHLHYGGEIYALNEKQWADFSKQMMQVFATKLQNTNKVTFNQLMGVSEAVAEL
jgi:hypothetical protein